MSASDLQALRWYHTIDLPDGSSTPGEYDLRSIVGSLPWPSSLAGKRCLDVGSRDGFYAFEMERRGAAEVVSLDIDDPDDVAFPASTTPSRELIEGELMDGHRAFEAAAEALDSKVQRRFQSVYALDEAEVGRFDFAGVGTLLLHLRDPVRALMAVHRVLDGELLVNDPVSPGLSLFLKRPYAELYMKGGPFWWICNPAGQMRMIEAAGFHVVRAGHPYVIPWGRGYHRPPLRADLRGGGIRGLPRRLFQRRGALHSWALATTGSGFSQAG